MKHLLAYFFIFIIQFQFSYGADVLFMYMFTSKSHFSTMFPLANFLLNKGHNISIFGFDGRVGTANGNKMLNLEINEENSKDEPNGSKAAIEMCQEYWWNSDVSSYNVDLASIGAFETFRSLYNKTKVDRILNHNYDIVISDDMFNVIQAPIIAKLRQNFNTTFALFSTTTYYDSTASRYGLSRNPVASTGYFHSIRLFHYDQFSFLPRMHHFTEAVFDFWAALTNDAFSIKAGNILGVQFDPLAFYYEKSWAFIDYPRFLFTPQPIASDITSVSEVCIDVDEELPLEFKTFMEKPNSKGTIFVAYGNNVYWQQAPENVTTEFLSALEYFEDYQIIWTVRYKGLTTTKSNVKITNWAPQRAILKHNSTVLFLSHCGLKSIKEAVCSEVPLVVSPFFSDQTKNAFELVQNDIAVLISKFEMNRINIVNTLQKVLSNLEHYKKNVIRFKKLFTDNVKNPLEVSSHFIERAIRIKKDTKKFKIAGLFSDFQTTYYFTSIALIYVLICLIASK